MKELNKNQLLKAYKFISSYGDDDQKAQGSYSTMHAVRCINELADLDSGVKSLAQVQHHPPETLLYTIRVHRSTLASVIWEVRAKSIGRGGEN